MEALERFYHVIGECKSLRSTFSQSNLRVYNIFKAYVFKSLSCYHEGRNLHLTLSNLIFSHLLLKLQREEERRKDIFDGRSGYIFYRSLTILFIDSFLQYFFEHGIRKIFIYLTNVP